MTTGVNENHQDAAWFAVIIAMTGAGVGWHTGTLPVVAVSVTSGVMAVLAIAGFAKVRQVRYWNRRAAALRAHPSRRVVDGPGRRTRTPG